MTTEDFLEIPQQHRRHLHRNPLTDQVTCNSHGFAYKHEDRQEYPIQNWLVERLGRLRITRIGYHLVEDKACLSATMGLLVEDLGLVVEDADAEDADAEDADGDGDVIEMVS